MLLLKIITLNTALFALVVQLLKRCSNVFALKVIAGSRDYNNVGNSTVKDILLQMFEDVTFTFLRCLYSSYLFCYGLIIIFTMIILHRVFLINSSMSAGKCAFLNILNLTTS
jgi:hypothetical protein